MLFLIIILPSRNMQAKKFFLLVFFGYDLLQMNIYICNITFVMNSLIYFR